MSAGEETGKKNFQTGMNMYISMICTCKYISTVIKIKYMSAVFSCNNQELEYLNVIIIIKHIFII